jgi:hypothetical protein
MKYIERFLVICLILMACCIVWNLAEYGIQELKDGNISLRPKGVKPTGGRYGD